MQMKSGATPISLGKIRSDELRDHVLHSDVEPTTVIVEVDLPVPQIAVSGGNRIGTQQARFSILPSATSSSTMEAKVAEIRRALTDALGRQPGKFLASSRSFILDATGNELSRIAALPTVLAIWPNVRR
ncbi:MULTISPECIES: hypothetical protein [Methylobacterium]|jgi:hypothetical protein|uniref:Uncharacterized protein n=2 Tax=Methylobacterium TaxID=407 RepID=A0A0C6FEY4_9HYPH|nr:MULTISPECIES: hypothetical protein [Methylobacterium]MBK3396820.1 hypothetical protein [Methylobacterium ajmalii]MBK3411800.1 hypothetical protein [Methylobacterium ajmalii]MBK3420403.1 hypothetical protein [Methylobacterium ajmalii]MBZ6412847.1 hypothetical protein [Methylobacterium sp.]SFE10857.1 hypothetical protein SAMN04487844_10148 [Methylobacterium sp. yr596]